MNNNWFLFYWSSGIFLWNAIVTKNNDKAYLKIANTEMHPQKIPVPVIELQNFHEIPIKEQTIALNNYVLTLRNEATGLATKLFRFFPLDDCSCLKSFFSIAIFSTYVVFDIWRFIDYSVKKVSCFVVYLLFCIDLKWRFQTVIFVILYFITSVKVKTQSKLGKNCMMFMVKNH